MTILWILAGMFVVGLVLFVLGACRVAGRYDEEIERTQREIRAAREEE